MSFSLERSIEILRRTPDALHGLLGGVSDFWARNNYGPNTFSPFDVVGHLLHAERVNWLTRLRIILEQGPAEPFPPFDRYAMYESSKGKSLSELLDAFAAERRRSVEALTSMQLTDEQLAARGRHPEFGEVTAGQLIATWVVHDLGHLHQIAKAMAYQYRDAVGPWRAYLTILPRE